MKNKTHLLTALLVVFFLAGFYACEKIEVLPPPDNEGTIEKSGTGNSDAKSILFLMNEKSTLFVNPASADTWIVSDEVTKYMDNNEFARPLDPAEPQKLSLDIFPTLVTEDFMQLQSPVGDLQQSDFPGAFGTTVSDDWHVGSTWWELEPQDIDYGYNPTEVTVIEGAITSNTTWTANNKYLLKGQVFVKEGVTLTIEPGTIIFGIKGVGITSGVLCFNRGSKVNANGTPDKPIIFTGTSPPGLRTRGQWGGVVFCGNAPSNKGDNVLLEGIQGPDPEDGAYGGNNPEDNSGSFSYWRVEYAGIAVSPGNELNSLTFGGVGNQTEMHHIIVTYAGDDALEWFGGDMNTHHIGVYNCLDDDLDMDAGFQGDVQYVYIVRNPYSADESGSACFEVSSSKTVGTQPQTQSNISNVTVVGTEYQLYNTGLFGDPKYQGGMYSKQDAHCYIINSILVGCPIGVQNP